MRSILEDVPGLMSVLKRQEWCRQAPLWVDCSALMEAGLSEEAVNFLQRPNGFYSQEELWASFSGKYFHPNVAFCYDLNVCVPHRFIHWNLTPKVMVFGGRTSEKWCSHEEGASRMRVVPLFKKKKPAKLLAPSSPHKHTGRRTLFEPGKGSLAGPEYTDTLVLDSQPLKPWKINFCSF